MQATFIFSLESFPHASWNKHLEWGGNKGWNAFLCKYSAPQNMWTGFLPVLRLFTLGRERHLLPWSLLFRGGTKNEMSRPNCLCFFHRVWNRICCGFTCSFPDDQTRSALLHLLTGHLHVFFCPFSKIHPYMLGLDIVMLLKWYFLLQFYSHIFCYYYMEMYLKFVYGPFKPVTLWLPNGKGWGEG